MAATLDELLPILATLSSSRDERRSLAELARMAGRSPSSFQRAFSRIVGESPKQYTLRLQLECAAVQLLSSDASVLQIALATGFESHEGFTRAFARHFGQPPKDFRAQGIASGLADRVRHIDLVTHVGPCLRLFRASTGSGSTQPRRPTAPHHHPTSTRNEPVMHYDITQQSIEPTTLLYKKARCEHGKIAETLGQILPAVFGYATTEGIEMVGPPMTLYVEWGPGMTTIHAGLPVKAGATGRDDIEVAVLPAGDAAVTIHTGSYDGLGDAHAAVEVYLDDNGLTVAGPLREIYLTDPGEVPNPDEWKTQIIWPVRKGS